MHEIQDNVCFGNRNGQDRQGGPGMTLLDKAFTLVLDFEEPEGRECRVMF